MLVLFDQRLRGRSVAGLDCAVAVPLEIAHDDVADDLFVIDDEGNLEKRLEVLAGATIDGAAGNYLRFSNMPPTAPTTSLTKGDFFICAGSTNMSLALCIDTTANTLRYFTPNSITFGRDTLA